MTNERWLKCAIARYYRSKGYKVSMKPARVGNAMVDECGRFAGALLDSSRHPG